MDKNDVFFLVFFLTEGTHTAIKAVIQQLGDLSCISFGVFFVCNRCTFWVA